MATMKKIYILVAFACSTLASLISVVSLATQNWIFTAPDIWKWNVDSDVMQTFTTTSYGLFNGYVETKFPFSATLELDLTCDFGDNICAMMCGNDDNKTSVLKKLHQGEFDIADLNGCISLKRSLYLQNTEEVTTDSSDSKVSDTFINAGVWISTVIFQVLSMVCGCLSSIVAFVNFISNPYQLIFSLMVIYISSSLALFCSVMVMLLWGIMYASKLRHDLCTVFTIANLMGPSTSSSSSLGYSYWINIIPILLYIACIAVLYLRQKLVSKDPGQKMIERENTVDPDIYSY